MDQHLHPDEPIKVDAVHRHLNPIRRLYRAPWDYLYRAVLEPKLVRYLVSINTEFYYYFLGSLLGHIYATVPSEIGTWSSGRVLVVLQSEVRS